MKNQQNFLKKDLKYQPIDQPIESDIKRYEEIKKLTIGQNESQTTGCLFDYERIKDYYRLTVGDLSRRKALDVDPKAFQQIKFIGQLKKLNNDNNNNLESMFILTILEEIKETRSKLSQGSATKTGQLSRSKS